MSDADPWRVRLGSALYEVRPSWCRLPDGGSPAAVSQVAVDSAGRIYALLRADPPVMVFDAGGAYLHSIGAGRVLDSHGICIDAQDRVWVVDRDAHQLLVFDTGGRELFRLGQRGFPEFGAPFNHPTDVAVAPDGEIYVSDGYGNACVHRFTPEGALIGSWGAPGGGPGEFSTPHAVWVHGEDRVLVADRENDRVQVFDRAGGLVAIWPDVYRPMDIAGTAEGILVTDQVPRVSLFSIEGRLLGRGRPVLNGAHGIWCAPNGDIYCAEMIPPRITRLQRLHRDEVGFPLKSGPP